MENEVVNETVADSVDEVQEETLTETDNENDTDAEEQETEDAKTDDESAEEDDEDEPENDVDETEDDEDYDENPFGYEEFDYDEDGNIIIPEETANAPDTETKPEDETGNDEENDLRARLAAAEKKVADLEEHGKKVLKGYGIEAESVEDGLIKLAAESDGISVDEYKTRHTAEKEAQAQLLKTDLEALHTAFPETKQYNSILEIPNVARFGALRDMGLSPKEAYSAANPDLVRSSASKAAKKTSSGKSHLRSVTGRGVTGKTDTVIPSREMRMYRELFPNMTDAQIRKLYNDTKS